jgi:hypothetical protein
MEMLELQEDNRGLTKCEETFDMKFNFSIEARSDAW